MSDRHNAEKEIIDKIEPGEAVMVDRGYNIGHLLQESAKLRMPPFKRGKNSTLYRKEIFNQK